MIFTVSLPGRLRSLLQFLSLDVLHWSLGTCLRVWGRTGYQAQGDRGFERRVPPEALT